MAEVLPACSPSSLLQRRLSQGQYGSMEITGLMSTFNIQLRPEAALAAASATMPVVLGQQHHAQQLSAYGQTIPAEMIDPSTVHAATVAGMQYTNPYNLSSGFEGASFGSLGWPAVASLPHMTAPQATLLRTDSHGSSDSEPYIKSEGQSPVRPSQVFYDAGLYSMADGGSAIESSDEGKPTSFSTEIDTLMKAIQSQTNDPKKPQTEKNKSEIGRAHV